MSGRPESILEIQDLTVTYGRLTAVDGISLNVRKGEIYGLVGPNGAGKTTIIRCAATLLPPNGGRVRVCGHDASLEPREATLKIGYMPDFFGVYDNLKVFEYLDFFAALFGLRGPRLLERVDTILELTHLEGKRDAYVETLSRGMKQRLCLAKTILHEPRLLLLDEPASGLDPRARIEIREILKELAKQGSTIFISSHILKELSDLCTHVGIIEKGRLVGEGTLDQLFGREHRGCSLRVRVLNGERAENALSGPEGIIHQRLEEGLYRVWTSDFDEGAARMVRLLFEAGAEPVEVSPEKTDLEAAFMRLTKGEVS